MKFFLSVFLVLQILFASAQVNDIKNSSSQNASSRGGGERGGGSSAGGAFFAQVFIQSLQGIATWQQYKLDRRSKNEYIVSLDILGQAAIQPSRYYLINPSCL